MTFGYRLKLQSLTEKYGLSEDTWAISDTDREGRVGVLGNRGTCQRTIGGTVNKQKSVEGTREQLVCFQGTGNTVKD